MSLTRSRTTQVVNRRADGATNDVIPHHGNIIMTRKFAILLATVATCGALPQAAQASCSGSACFAFSYANSKFTNKDKDLKIHLTGCIINAANACASPPVNFDIFVDPNSSKQLTVPASAGPDVKVDVKSAAFVGALQQPHVQTLPGASPVAKTTNNPTGGGNSTKSDGCQLSMEKENCEISRNLKLAEEARKRRDQARVELAKARDEQNTCLTNASQAPKSLQFTVPCLGFDQKINSLVAEISKDDKVLGETEPGAPVRLGTVVDTRPTPAKPTETAKDKVQNEASKKLGGCKPGKTDLDSTFDGKAAGCAFDTNAGH
jgi:hypothetical protein